MAHVRQEAGLELARLPKLLSLLFELVMKRHDAAIRIFELQAELSISFWRWPVPQVVCRFPVLLRQDVQWLVQRPLLR